MMKSKLCLTGLPAEILQRICDYIASDAGDKTMKVTLDQHNRLHFENGKSILNLALTSKTIFEKAGVCSYLFQYITFVLTDSQRTCRDIVRAFSQALTKANRECVHKIAIPFFTIRGLFDPALFLNPLYLESRLTFSLGINGIAQLHPYVVQRLGPHDHIILHATKGVLREELADALTMLYQMPALTHLKLGVDVIEFLAESAIPASWPADRTPNLAATLDQVRQGEVTSDHALPNALKTLRSKISTTKKLPESQPPESQPPESQPPESQPPELQLQLDWKDFVSNTYTRAGLALEPSWTPAVKKEMEVQFEKIITAYLAKKHKQNPGVMIFD